MVSKCGPDPTSSGCCTLLSIFRVKQDERQALLCGCMDALFPDIHTADACSKVLSSETEEAHVSQRTLARQTWPGLVERLMARGLLIVCL
jgi:hypothetical protein